MHSIFKYPSIKHQSFDHNSCIDSECIQSIEIKPSHPSFENWFSRLFLIFSTLVEKKWNQPNKVVNLPSLISKTNCSNDLQSNGLVPKAGYNTLTKIP
jgi:hypothetical protein